MFRNSVENIDNTSSKISTRYFTHRKMEGFTKSSLFTTRFGSVVAYQNVKMYVQESNCYMNNHYAINNIHEPIYFAELKLSQLNASVY